MAFDLFRVEKYNINNQVIIVTGDLVEKSTVNVANSFTVHEILV